MFYCQTFDVLVATQAVNIQMIDSMEIHRSLVFELVTNCNRDILSVIILRKDFQIHRKRASEDSQLPHRLAMRYNSAMLLKMLGCWINLLARCMIHIICVDGMPHKFCCVLCWVSTITKHFHVGHNWKRAYHNKKNRLETLMFKRFIRVVIKQQSHICFEKNILFNVIYISNLWVATKILFIVYVI